MYKGISEIMYFVPDRRAAAGWYARLFEAEIITLENPEHFFIRIGGQDVWFHIEDAKMPAGGAGQVAYWEVEDFDRALARAEDLGALLYRGPLDREDGTFMCQVKDPFGNLVGIFGPKQ